MTSCFVLQNSRILRTGRAPRTIPPPLCRGRPASAIHPPSSSGNSLISLLTKSATGRLSLFSFPCCFFTSRATLTSFPVSVAPFLFAFSHFRLTSPTLLKKPWAFARKQTSFRQKSTSFKTKQTSKIRYVALPFGLPPHSSLSPWGVGAQRLFI